MARIIDEVRERRREGAKQKRLAFVAAAFVALFVGFMVASYMAAEHSREKEPPTDKHEGRN